MARQTEMKQIEKKVAKKEIRRLVDKYAISNNYKALFKAELEYLVLIAEREQMKKDMLKIMGKL